MPENELLEAINQLRTTVIALNDTLKNDYPKKSDIRKDRQKFVVLILIGLVLSAVVGVFTTVGVVSGCFLSKSAYGGHAPGVCSIMPGYSDAQARNARVLSRFEGLISDIETNKAVNQRQDAQIRKLQQGR